jgi:hypothetical protein
MKKGRPLFARPPHRVNEFEHGRNLYIGDTCRHSVTQVDAIGYIAFLLLTGGGK